MSEERALTLLEERTLVQTSPLDMLALMGEAEFNQRLDNLKTAQYRMARIQRELMEADVDYGVIPGTGSKPTLLKPGAEKLCKFHHLVATFKQDTILGDGVTQPHIRILTTCSLHYEAADGPIVGQGTGAANSWEKKYRWREAKRQCPTCGAAAIFRSKYPDKNNGELGWYCYAKVGGCGATFREHDTDITEQQQGQAENPDPFDGENTLKKMSNKRAYIDAALRATATSGLFTQDLEDMEPTAPQAALPPQPSMPEARPAARPVPATPSRAAPPTAAPPPTRAARPAPPAPIVANTDPSIEPARWATWDKLVVTAKRLGLWESYVQASGLAFVNDRPAISRAALIGTENEPGIGRAFADMVGAGMVEMRGLQSEWEGLFDKAKQLGIQAPILFSANGTLREAQGAVAALSRAVEEFEKEIPAPGSAEEFEQELAQT